MITLNTVEDAIARKINDSPRDVFMLKDFNDIASGDQVLLSLNQLEEKGKIVRMGKSIYAKAIFSPLSECIVLCRSVESCNKIYNFSCFTQPKWLVY